MQLAAVDGQQVVLLLEDHQFVHPSFLEMVNSLLSSGQFKLTNKRFSSKKDSRLLLGFYIKVMFSYVLFKYVVGEVPGLYSTEELEPLLSSLKDQASQDGFTAPVLNYFSNREYTKIMYTRICACVISRFCVWIFCV